MGRASVQAREGEDVSGMTRRAPAVPAAHSPGAWMGQQMGRRPKLYWKTPGACKRGNATPKVCWSQSWIFCNLNPRQLRICQNDSSCMTQDDRHQGGHVGGSQVSGGTQVSWGTPTHMHPPGPPITPRFRGWVRLLWPFLGLGNPPRCPTSL